MRGILIILLIFSSFFEGYANHTKGGYFSYEYLGPGVTNTSNLRYRVTLKVYMDIGASTAQVGGNINFTYFNKPSFTLHENRSVAIVSENSISNCTQTNCYPCFSPIPLITYKIITYVDIVELPVTPNGYTVSYQRCCRINGLENIQAPSNSVGGTWTIDIPGTSVIADAEKNSSPVFFNNDTTIICKNSFFNVPFNASDVNGDVLTYEFVPALIGGDNGANSAPTTAATPPYNNINYAPGYSGLSPLGGNVSIDPQTGFISGIAPTNGEYVITVKVNEFRNGIKIGEVRKEIHLKIGDCSVIKAELNFNNITCDGFTQTFVNAAGNASGLINSYSWNFGVVGVTNDTSSLQSPTFTFPDTGVYFIKLIVNKGQPCSDSTVRSLAVYPGFFPAFNSTGVCYNSPIQFTDASTTDYGIVDSWRWDFGDLPVLNDTSRIRNPQYLYPSSGVKNVQLIVTNSKGCIDTLDKPITLIDKPTITLPFKDTLICSIDTLQLQSVFSSGNATWTPNYRIINPTTNNPFVYPLVTTTYTVTSNDQGCVQSDTIRVNVKDFVTVDVMPDTAICLTDRIILRTNSDALSYVWTPSATLNSATVKSPIATPIANVTKYYVNANIGKCQSNDSVTIISNPYPSVTVNNDTTICFGDKAQLIGTVTGSSFNWSPLNGLTNFNTLTPSASPPRTTTYILSTQGAVGCLKPAFDTVVVTIIPPIQAFAGIDTTIVRGQPLQLNASGSTNYLWKPRNFLNNDTISNPIATLLNNQIFVVRVSNISGCFAFDTVKVTVFLTEPDIFVPTAFTPNADGRNDILVPVPVGLRSYDYFEVFNRWGNKMYSTTQLRQGWDGSYKGLPQISDTYVWQVRGTDYTGKTVFKKGTVILLR